MCIQYTCMNYQVMTQCNRNQQEIYREFLIADICNPPPSPMVESDDEAQTVTSFYREFGMGLTNTRFWFSSKQQEVIFPRFRKNVFVRIDKTVNIPYLFGSISRRPSQNENTHVSEDAMNKTCSRKVAADADRPKSQKNPLKRVSSEKVGSWRVRDFTEIMYNICKFVYFYGTGGGG